MKRSALALRLKSYEVFHVYKLHFFTLISLIDSWFGHVKIYTIRCKIYTLEQKNILMHTLHSIVCIFRHTNYCQKPTQKHFTWKSFTRACFAYILEVRRNLKRCKHFDGHWHSYAALHQTWNIFQSTQNICKTPSITIFVRPTES